MINNIVDNSLNNLVYDMSNLNNLKRQAANGSQESITQVAKQFEDVFVQMMMKTMRQAIPEGGLLNSESLQLFTSMFDQQVIQQASGTGFGLADMLIKQMLPKSSEKGNLSQAQLSTEQGPPPSHLAQSLFADNSLPISATKALGTMLYQKLQPDEVQKNNQPAHINQVNDRHSTMDKMTQFVKEWLTPARQASKVSGIPHEVIIAQAALETGWGEKQIKTVDGQQTYNHFGIKAGSSWTGEKTTLTTTEYINNEKRLMKDQFRVYNSHAEALEDYTSLITLNPRYQAVVNADTPESVARALQDANYATDPNYADKLIQLIDRIKMIEKDVIKSMDSGISQLFHNYYTQ